MKNEIVFLALMIPWMAVAQSGKSYHVKDALTQPVIFVEGVVSTGDYESHAEFSPGGDTLYFVKSAPDVSKWTICVSWFVNGKWTTPEVASFSGQYMDADPFFSGDGKTLYFISNRPRHEGEPARADMDIWKIEKSKTGWSKPIWLEEPINSDASEYYPTFTDNNTLYFGSRRKGGKGGSDIYRCEVINGQYQTPVNLGDAINTDGSEFEPFISPDERFLIFMAARPDDLANADLYVSYNANGQWSKAEKLPVPLNSDATEFSPKVTRDKKYFFFASSRNRNPSTTSKPETMKDVLLRIRSAGNGLCDIYQVDFSALSIK